MNQDFTDSFLNETKNHKSLKTMGDVVGLPDQEDKERIQRFILRFEKAHPGDILAIRNLARAQFNAVGGDTQRFGVVNKAAHGRTLFELPEPIGKWLEEAYPLMFRDPKHTAWFAKHFPELLIPERY